MVSETTGPTEASRRPARVPEHVLAAELEEIGERRRRVAGDDPTQAAEPPDPLHLVGLALSGGGIRSATVNLGLVQALARSGWLEHVDYLSTVSGGGFLGGCLSTSLNDPKRSTAWDAGFPFHLQTGADDPPAMRHLRDHAAYLNERGSGGPLAMLALVLRGVVVHALALLPLVILLAFFTRWAYGDWAQAGWHPRGGAGWFIGTLGVLGILAASCLLFPLGSWIAGRSPTTNPLARRRRWGRLYGLLLGAGCVVFIIELSPWLLHATYGSEGLLAGLSVASAGSIAGSMAGPIARLSRGPLGVLLRPVLIIFAGLLGPSLLLLAYTVVGGLVVFGRGQFDGVLIVLAVVLAVWNLFLLDLNATSLFQFYRDRLSATFLFTVGEDGATHGADELKLSELGAGLAPYHLINTTVNVGGASALDTRGRRGDFFVYAKRYSGGRRTTWRETRQLEALDPNLNVGTAVAISGAAVAPNMGTMTQGALVMLMTLLNLRAGRWMHNPRHARRPNPVGLGLRHLARELLGRVGGATPTINLSDGGHLENLGVFALLERRCRVIICGDAEADPAMNFQGLATVIRYAATDLGVHIDISLDAVRPRPDDRGQLRSERGWAVGRIHYTDDPADHGWLIYVKSTTTGDEAEHIREYQGTHPSFPHESTGDQFFDEAQFEAYRALGFKLGRSLCREVVGPDTWSRMPTPPADGSTVGLESTVAEPNSLQALHETGERTADTEPAW